MKIRSLFILSLFWLCQTNAQTDSSIIAQLYRIALTKGQSYQMLEQLAGGIGGRLSGSPQSYKAVAWGKKVMEKWGFDSVWLQPCMVPHWVRGAKEECSVKYGKGKLFTSEKLRICALGGSIATPKEGITAEILMVDSVADLAKLGEAKVKGKIVFFSRPMDRAKITTFEAYGGAVDQRYSGPSEAAQYGAVGTIVRSMDIGISDHPHTGTMKYNDSFPKVPCGAISTQAAEDLMAILKTDPHAKLYMKMNCKTLPDTLSYNVVGEIRGSEKPEEIICVGGHLDSWDNGDGAHDDGAGCVHSIEAVRLFKALGIRPKRTIRAVLFMNEENGVRGGNKYAELAKLNNEKHIVAIESDGGGHVPKGFGMSGASEEQMKKFMGFAKHFQPYHVYEFTNHGGGTDIGPLREQGVPQMGFIPDSQRYFDLHHTEIDIMQNVNRRELELGSATIGAMLYLLSEYGL